MMTGTRQCIDSPPRLQVHRRLISWLSAVSPLYAPNRLPQLLAASNRLPPISEVAIRRLSCPHDV